MAPTQPSSRQGSLVVAVPSALHVYVATRTAGSPAAPKPALQASSAVALYLVQRPVQFETFAVSELYPKYEHTVLPRQPFFAMSLNLLCL